MPTVSVGQAGYLNTFYSVQFSHSVVSSSFQSHGLQHSRLPCLSPTRRARSNSCPSSQWCHPTISSSVVPFLLLPSVFPSIKVFSNELALHIRGPKYWSSSFSISTPNEYSGLISFRVEWFDLFAVQYVLGIRYPTRRSCIALMVMKPQERQRWVRWTLASGVLRPNHTPALPEDSCLALF